MRTHSDVPSWCTPTITYICEYADVDVEIAVLLARVREFVCMYVCMYACMYVCMGNCLSKNLIYFYSQCSTLSLFGNPRDATLRDAIILHGAKYCIKIQSPLSDSDVLSMVY